MDQKKRIGNVNLLDARKATEQSVAEIRGIGNVNVMIVTPDTAHLASRLSIGNINALVEVPAEGKVHHSVGRQILNKEFLREVESPFFSVNIGQVIVESDIPPSDIETKLQGMVVIGQLVCPEPLMGLIQSKCQQVIGETVAYPVLGNVIMNSVTLDSATLQSYADNSEVAIIGSLTVPKVVTNELIERKIARLFVSGKVTAHEENLSVLQSKLVKPVSSTILIPAGYALVEKDLVLDGMMLGMLPSKKLYCTENVVIDAQVTAGLLEQSLDSLVCNGKLIFPKGLSKVIAAICDPLETQIVSYEGLLWNVDGMMEVSTSQLEKVPEQVTILVSGMVNFAQDIPVELLEQKIARLDNMGMVRCTKQQQASLESKMGVRDGMFEDSQAEPVEEEESEDHQIGNINFLTL